MTRAWFRRRLDAEPRRWVLFLAALEGLVALTLRFEDQGFLRREGPLVIVPALFLVLAPALGVLGMLMHGRLVLWGGRLLGGKALPQQIHAAFAWSQAPFVLAGVPCVLAVAARALLQTLGTGRSPADDLLRSATGPLATLAALVALPGAMLYVLYLAEVQAFRVRRALLNQLLGAAILLAIVGASAAITYLLFPRLPGLAAFAAMGAVGISLAFTAEWATARHARRVGRAG